MTFKKLMKDCIQDVQKEISDKAGRYVNRYSVRQRKIGLIVFGLSAGTICFLLLFGIVGQDDSDRAIKVDSITLPQSARRISLDSVKSLPTRVIDSLQNLVKQLYHDRMK